MNETSKTVAFVVTATILGIAAGWSHYSTQPKSNRAFEKVGQEFFPDFQDGTVATSLIVTAYDEDTDGVQEFSVQQDQDGLWRIPSHHNYPAEATERLAKTATSLIGIVRESVAARRANRHDKLGVVDPADEQADSETAGKRITLRDKAGNVVADYIIGKPAGTDPDDSESMIRSTNQEPDFYYVRVPGEKETYKARVNIDLSTRFSDWINTDLLKVEAGEINLLEFDKYELVSEDVKVGNQVVTQVAPKTIDQQRLTRKDNEPWQLESLNPATEQLEELKIESLITLLDSLKISGVRPKLKLEDEFLVLPDLTINRELLTQKPRLFQSRFYDLQLDLDQKGFSLGQSSKDPDSLILLASRGELRAATKYGVRYTLYIGRTVTGDQKEIEIGSSPTATPPDENPKQTNDNSNQNPEANVPAEENSEIDANSGKSRYVAIRVEFDPAALGPAPVKPTEPTAPQAPEGFDEWKKQKEKAEEGKEAKESNDAKAKDDKATEDQKSDDAPPLAPQDIAAENEQKYKAHEAALEAYEQATIQYTTDLELYDTKVAEFEARKKEGQETAEDLNERFAEWFYVVPAESLALLRLNRQDFVSPLETEQPDATSPASPGESLPNQPAADLPGGLDMEEAAKSELEKSGIGPPPARPDSGADKKKSDKKEDQPENQAPKKMDDDKVKKEKATLEKDGKPESSSRPNNKSNGDEDASKEPADKDSTDKPKSDANPEKNGD